MKLIIATTVILASLLAGCGKKEPTNKDYSKTTASEAKVPNIRVYCYDGVKYFAVWNNNAVLEPYLTGAKIDRKTLKPETCNE